MNYSNVMSASHCFIFYTTEPTVSDLDAIHPPTHTHTYTSGTHIHIRRTHTHQAHPHTSGAPTHIRHTHTHIRHSFNFKNSCHLVVVLSSMHPSSVHAGIEGKLFIESAGSISNDVVSKEKSTTLDAVNPGSPTSMV